MKNYTNKKGYFLAIIIAIIYAFISQENFEFYTFFINLIVILFINTILTGIISVFWKFKNFGKVIGITSLLVCLTAFLGIRMNDSEKKEKLEIEQKNYNTISENYKKVYSEFNIKLNTDERKDILEILLLSNKLFDGNIDEVSRQLDEVDEYYNWIRTTNDSLFNDLEKQLNEYKDELEDNSKKNEIEKNIMQLKITKGRAILNYVNTNSVITEMRKLLSIKKDVSTNLKTGKYYFTKLIV